MFIKIFFMFFYTISLFSFNVSSYIKNLNLEEQKAIERDGYLYIFTYSKNAYKRLKLIPKDLPHFDNLKEKLSQRGVNALGEFVYSLKKSEAKNYREYIYNSLSDIESFKKAMFFNEDKKIERVLFENAYLVENSQELKKKKFNKIENIEREREEFAILEPKPFNAVLFKLDYKNEAQSLYFKAESLENLKYNVSLINKNNFLIDVILFEDENTLFIYGVASSRLNSFLGVVPTFAINLIKFRYKGLFTWYFNEYLKNLA